MKSHSQSSRVIPAHSRFKVGSTDPSTFRPEFDAISELAYNRDQYTGEHQLSIYSFPSYLRTCIDKIRAHAGQMSTSGKPGISAAIACCVYHGMKCLQSNDDIKELIRLKEQFDLDDKLNTRYAEEIAIWFRSSTISVLDGSGTGTKRQSLYVPEELRQSVCSFSTEIGVVYSVTVTIAAMITLSLQNHISKENKALLESAVDAFYDRMSLRREFAEVLMKRAEKATGDSMFPC